MLEPRQQAVTRGQVEHRIQDAKHRALDAVMAAIDAKTAAEYNEALRAGCKAASDYETWRKVLPSLP